MSPKLDRFRRSVRESICSASTALVDRPGLKSAIHTHPGPEVFFVLSGKVGQKTPHGVTYAQAGMTTVGHGSDTPMEAFNVGSIDFEEMVIFLVDANRKFSSPTNLD